MKLLLDEHYSPKIAQQLRKAGYDVGAVSEDPALIGMDDDPLLRHATAERRVLVTENVADFVALAQAWAGRGDEHCGLVFTSAESLPRSNSTIGLFVRKLRDLLEAHPQEEALRGQVRWLR